VPDTGLSSDALLEWLTSELLVDGVIAVGETAGAEGFTAAG
jgi:hypothetical protein